MTALRENVQLRRQPKLLVGEIEQGASARAGKPLVIVGVNQAHRRRRAVEIFFTTIGSSEAKRFGKSFAKSLEMAGVEAH